MIGVAAALAVTPELSVRVLIDKVHGLLGYTAQPVHDDRHGLVVDKIVEVHKTGLRRGDVVRRFQVPAAQGQRRAGQLAIVFVSKIGPQLHLAHNLRGGQRDAESLIGVSHMCR